MRWSFRPMRDEDARSVATWRYDGPLAFYDFLPADLGEILADLPSFSAAVDDRDELLGYFMSGPGAQVPGGREAELYLPDALDIGLGLRPDLVGQGHGVRFVVAGLAHLKAILTPPPERFRLSVAAFNTRAIHVYTRAGFRAVGLFSNPERDDTETPFLLMRRP